MNIDQLITKFIQASIEAGDIKAMDEIYKTNQLLALLQKEYYKKITFSEISENRLSLLDALIEYAVAHGVIDDLVASKEILEAKIMDLITPSPSETNHIFWENYQKSPKLATDVFYAQSKDNNYIKTREIAQNIDYTYADPMYGNMQITINLSKPEKDPAEIALAAKNKANYTYPSNFLVVENEGYAGNLNHPARSNHRIIRININQEEWGFQYSPYAYFNEHAIFLAIEHRPMKITTQAIENLLEIINQFPHYFVGSNADLPIVGGSILSQDHYQAGNHHFPIEKAASFYTFSIADLPDVTANLVVWPLSTIRLTSKNKQQLVAASEKILSAWKQYTDESVDIIAHTGETPHNTVTPIARRNGDDFELDLVLRNNRTSDEFPDGIFHPHPHVQHIKRENIGLIEVMGLAILPGRLKTELIEVKHYLLGEANEINPSHLAWAKIIKADTHMITQDNVDQLVNDEIGKVFTEVLENAGVFKMDKTGQEAFIQFVNTL